MSEASDVVTGDALAEVGEIIARLRDEIDRLSLRLSEASAARELRDGLMLAAAAGTIASPTTHDRLLEMVVETAASVISAQAASLFLIDEETQELVFEVALGGKAEEVKKFRLPMGKGVAGLVALTGQAMAISDAQADPRQAREIAQSVGYTPKNILCVPLFYNDEIIGVLELLDKADGSAFDAEDMDTLGLFANQAAVAIEQSRVQRNIAALMSDAIASIADISDEQRASLANHADQFMRQVEGEDPAYRRAIDLARLVREIAWLGEREAGLCERILRNLSEYLRSARASLTEFGAYE
jgi:GAF domain-containing protein